MRDSVSMYTFQKKCNAAIVTVYVHYSLLGIMHQGGFCVMIGGSTSYRSNALSPGIEPRRTAPEADALSIELGEHYS